MTPKSNGADRPPVGPAILVDALERHFGNVLALDGISFRVERGEFFALLGPNGAGKSTTLNVLTTLIKPSGGRAAVMGFDVVGRQADVRRTLGIVFQDPALDDRLTARENLEIHAVLYGVRRSDRASAIDQALTWADLVSVADRGVRSFSGGMKRRLELARALMHGPSVLFLDEPTLGLDPQGRRNLWSHVERLRADGMTVLMTTHNLPEAEACDRVGIIDHGSLVAVGAPRDLIADHAPGGNLEDVFIKLTGHALRDELATARDMMVSFADRGGEHTR